MKAGESTLIMVVFCLQSTCYFPFVFGPSHWHAHWLLLRKKKKILGSRDVDICVKTQSLTFAVIPVPRWEPGRWEWGWNELREGEYCGRTFIKKRPLRKIWDPFLASLLLIFPYVTIARIFPYLGKSGHDPSITFSSVSNMERILVDKKNLKKLHEWKLKKIYERANTAGEVLG